MLPWLAPVWQRLNQARVTGRLPHALLISGVEGAGKQVLAEHLARALLCERPDRDGNPCGQCPACGWMQAGTHPDLVLQMPEEPGKAIKVDEIRSLCANLAMTSHAGYYKVAIMSPAEALNVNAANSLLKTLEEPTDNTILILLSAIPGRLPATIRSRCQRIALPLPEPGEACRWLESQGLDAHQARRCLHLAAGAPLRALQLAEANDDEFRERCLSELQQVFSGQLDPLKVAADWAAGTEQPALVWWRRWLEDAVRWKMAGCPPEESRDAVRLQQIVETVDCRVLFALGDRIANALNSLGSGLNRQLVLEDLLISWADHARGIEKRPVTGSR